jgi:hypothetical protein
MKRTILTPVVEKQGLGDFVGCLDWVHSEMSGDVRRVAHQTQAGCRKALLNETLFFRFEAISRRTAEPIKNC